PAADGVFKRAWAGLFFGAAGADLSAGADLPGGLSGGTSATGGSTGGTPPVGTGLPGGTGQPGTGQPGGAPVDPTCGRFAQDVCHAYLTIATAGHGDQSTVDLLHRSSPASILDRITAPTLLVQGEADSLFPLSEAEANAKGIAAHGTPVRVAWFTGGHDGGSGPQSDQDRVKYLTAQWFDHYLRGAGPAPSNSFTYSRIAGLSASTDGYVALGFSVADYPGLSGNATVRVPVAGAPQPVANPPNGTPGALSSLPGTGGGVASLAGVASDIPGQHADFYSAPLRSTVDVVGAPAVRIRAASPTGEAVLFVKLYDLDPSSGASLPDGLVAPVRLSGLPASIEQATPVTVTLPAIVHRFEAGHLLRITIATSDQGYATPAQPALYTVALGDPATANTVALPTVRSEPIATPNVIWRWVLVALGVLIALGIATAVLVGRRRYRRAATAGAIATAGAGDAGPADPDVPLVVQGLRKAYDDGFVAVSNVDFIVHRGQVVGLLGPNGAGKTTTLRVLMGLTRPTAGEVYVFGHRLVPGAPVLSRIGALVEGPGFMPHVSGLGNLRLYWQATGRPERDAHFEEALEIAGLGDAIHRKVRKYSHGMKQRLAIAQAMLGLPDLLVLDEPTDGLDPPQIAEMRRVLHRYADPAGGRTVLLSSHLLAEVEQTCTHVVVVNKGRVVAQGPVDEIVGESPSVAFEVSDVDAGAQALRRLAGVGSVVADGSATLVADLDGTPRSAAVAALVNAGVGVNRVVPRRRLEDAFLSLVRED
ncbi:MAG: ATP-binding cassette domain-containing protein, partial [Micromonosporaceae bacterium]|nr:ATP-binding cassette domain-containing protein [Micromonosporaceae bacterium]